MFRVFLKKKIETSQRSTSTSDPKTLHVPGPERRRYERYDMDYKHLTLLNEADILSIREISLQGFSTEVSSRCFERLQKHDMFETRLRYRGEMYDLTARVAWKAGTSVGFQIVEASSEAMLFFRRLIAPAKIGNTLVKTDYSTDQSGDAETIKEWYRSPEDADLFVWRHRHGGHVVAWQLATSSAFIEWSDTLGAITGSLGPHMGPRLTPSFVRNGSALQTDGAIDASIKQFAVDVLMALRDPVRDELVATLTMSDGGT